MAEPLNNSASPWTAAVAPTVQGAFGLIGGALQYHYNKKLAEQQNQYNLNMWNLQNEYNSPQAQMKRLEEAGLNTALMYGQGSTGNAAHAPEQVTPQAPNIEGPMQKLAEAFNIEGLRTAVAKRRQAQADATMSEVAAANAKDEREAQHDVSMLYDLDPETGRYVFSSPDVTSIREASPEQKELKRRTGAISARAYYFNRILENNFRTNSLLYPRASLIDSTRRLNQSRINLLAPQIGMRNYEEKMFPYGYWIGNGTKVLNALPIPRLTFKK